MNQTRIWPENMNQAIQDVYLWALGRLPNTTESIRIINIHTNTHIHVHAAASFHCDHLSQCKHWRLTAIEKVRKEVVKLKT